MSVLSSVSNWIWPREFRVGPDLFGGIMYLDRYVNELTDEPAAPLRDEACEKLNWVNGKTGTVSENAGDRLYALVRDREPETIIETGVCNGFGTLHLLLGLAANDLGHLHSIDYPFRADQSLDEFRADTYDEFGGAQIPADKDPGWIVPDELRDRWTFREGKSQVELPNLLADTGSVDLFIHDSEHSSLCMAMEIDLSWHHLSPGGVLVVDDVSWSDAWDEFVTERNPSKSGMLAHDVAYAVKEGDQ